MAVASDMTHEDEFNVDTGSKSPLSIRRTTTTPLTASSLRICRPFAQQSLSHSPPSLHSDAATSTMTPPTRHCCLLLLHSLYLRRRFANLFTPPSFFLPLCSLFSTLLLDKSLRELAAEALYFLVKYDLQYFASTVVEKLIPCTLSSDLCLRHGATLACGELVLALHQCNYALPLDKQKSLAGIVPAIEKARLYRGKGGEIMHSAVSRFIECISISKVALSEKIKRSLLDTLNENLRHPNSQIQNAAVKVSTTRRG